MTTPTDRWAPLAAQLGADSIRATTAAAFGHPTSSPSSLFPEEEDSDGTSTNERRQP